MGSESWEFRKGIRGVKGRGQQRPRSQDERVGGAWGREGRGRTRGRWMTGDDAGSWIYPH